MESIDEIQFLDGEFNLDDCTLDLENTDESLLFDDLIKEPSTTNDNPTISNQTTLVNEQYTTELNNEPSIYYPRILAPSINNMPNQNYQQQFPSGFHNNGYNQLGGIHGSNYNNGYSHNLPYQYQNIPAGGFIDNQTGAITVNNFNPYMQPYPSNGYSSSTYSSDGYASAGYPSGGYSSSGYSSIGYPSEGFSSIGYPSEGYSSAGYASSGYASAGYPTNGYANGGYSSGGYQFNPMPAESVVHQPMINGGLSPNFQSNELEKSTIYVKDSNTFKKQHTNRRILKCADRKSPSNSSNHSSESYPVDMDDCISPTGNERKKRPRSDTSDFQTEEDSYGDSDLSYKKRRVDTSAEEHSEFVPSQSSNHSSLSEDQEVGNITEIPKVIGNENWMMFCHDKVPTKSDGRKIRCELENNENVNWKVCCKDESYEKFKKIRRTKEKKPSRSVKDISSKIIKHDSKFYFQLNTKQVEVVKNLRDDVNRSRIEMWHFFHFLLSNKEARKYDMGVKWINEENGSFIIINTKKVAALWGIFQGNENMTYESMSRNMR